jgi:hypothetical protein
MASEHRELLRKAVIAGMAVIDAKGSVSQAIASVELSVISVEASATRSRFKSRSPKGAVQAIGS